MTTKELKRLSRGDLLEMLLRQSKENEQLRAEVARLREELADRNIMITESGSLAEAALKLNGIFEAAQSSCDQYIQNIRNRSEHIEQHCLQMEQETQKKCEEMLAKARAEAQACLAEAERRGQEQTMQYGWIKDLLDDGEAQ